MNSSIQQKVEQVERYLIKMDEVTIQFEENKCDMGIFEYFVRYRDALLEEASELDVDITLDVHLAYMEGKKLFSNLGSKEYKWAKKYRSSKGPEKEMMIDVGVPNKKINGFDVQDQFTVWGGHYFEVLVLMVKIKFWTNYIDFLKRIGCFDETERIEVKVVGDIFMEFKGGYIKDNKLQTTFEFIKKELRNGECCFRTQAEQKRLLRNLLEFKQNEMRIVFNEESKKRIEKQYFFEDLLTDLKEGFKHNPHLLLKGQFVVFDMSDYYEGTDRNFNVKIQIHKNYHSIQLSHMVGQDFMCVSKNEQLLERVPIKKVQNLGLFLEFLEEFYRRNELLFEFNERDYWHVFSENQTYDSPVFRRKVVGIDNQAATIRKIIEKLNVFYDVSEFELAKELALKRSLLSSSCGRIYSKGISGELCFSRYVFYLFDKYCYVYVAEAYDGNLFIYVDDTEKSLNELAQRIYKENSEAVKGAILMEDECFF